MIRTGYDAENGDVIFPEQATSLEVIATVNHLNGSHLAAAKLYLENCGLQDALIDKAIKLIIRSIKIEKSALDYIKNKIQ